MAFEHINSKGTKYYLHSMESPLKGGHVQRIYFFARDIRDNAIDELPEDRMVVENSRTGLPVLKKKA